MSKVNTKFVVLDFEKKHAIRFDGRTKVQTVWWDPTGEIDQEAEIERYRKFGVIE